MKKLKYITSAILLSFVFVFTAFAFSSAIQSVISATYSTGGGGDTVKQAQLINDSVAYMGVTGYPYGVVTEFTANSDYTLTKVTVSLIKTGSPTTALLTARIWSYLGYNWPQSVLASSTNTIVISDVSESGGEYDFNFSGLSLTSGTNYWVGITVNSLNSASNYISIGRGVGQDAAFCPSCLGANGLVITTTDYASPTWSSLTSVDSLYIKLWGH